MKPQTTTSRPVAWLLLFAGACLLPFINKAVHIDDTLFLRAAEHIQKHPLDFYGFNMNWGHYTTPMIDAFDNPPLTCYYLALVASLAGWSEPALHLGLLIPALAAVWGIYVLGRRYCERPLLAGVVAVATPVLLISATTLMCDVMLLAFWVWAVVLFEEGLERNRTGTFLACGLLAGLAVLTKFTGLALIPLLALYGFVRQPRAGRWLLAPVVPLVMAVAYELVTRQMYGRGLLFAAAIYASHMGNPGGSHVAKAILGLNFMGGCFLPALFFAPWLWSRKTLLAGAGIIVIVALALPFAGKFNPPLWRSDLTFDWGLYAQSVIFIGAGLHLFALAGADFLRRRDATSLLLVVWMLGIFVFATMINWTLNGRSILPMLPAVALFVARGIEARRGRDAAGGFWRVAWPAIPACVIGLLLTRADYKLANSQRTAARELHARYQLAGTRMWFEGHWGFQYYMEKLGALPIDVKASMVTPGEIIIFPDNNTDVADMSTDVLRPVERREYRPNRLCATMNSSVGAGFYATIWGPLPFGVGEVDPEYYYVFEFAPSYAPGTRPANLSQTGALAFQKYLEGQAFRDAAALRTDPNNLEAHYGLGVFLATRAKPAEAMQQFREVLRLKPDDGRAHLEMARLLDRGHQTAEAITEYRAALRSLPDSTVALDNLAWILATQPDPKLRNGAEAVRLATRACELTGPKTAELLATLAAADAEAGRFDDATATARQAIDTARSLGRIQIVTANERLLALYESHRPYHQEASLPYPERR